MLIFVCIPKSYKIKTRRSNALLIFAFNSIALLYTILHLIHNITVVLCPCAGNYMGDLFTRDIYVFI